MRILGWISAALLGLGLLVAALAAHTWFARPLSIQWFYPRALAQMVLDQPELLSQLRLLEPLGLSGHNAKLADVSLAAGDRQTAQLRRLERQFSGYDRTALSPEDRVTYDAFDWFLRDQLETAERFRFHSFPTNPMMGLHSGLPDFMVQTHTIEHPRDAKHYLARLRQFPARSQQLIEGLEHRERLALQPPRIAVEQALVQMQRFIDGGPDANVLLTSFVDKLDAAGPERFPPAERARWIDAVRDAVRHEVLPAYETLIVWHEALLPTLEHSDGVWRMPEGAAYYAAAIRQHTTTDLDADTLHLLGLEEVARIGEQMEAILQAEGLTDGSLGTRITAISQRDDQRFEDSDAGRAEIIRLYQAHIDEISAGLDDWFDLRPHSPMEVRRVPEFAESGAPLAYYQPPALDGSRPGVFFINLRNVEEIPRFSMRTLAYHEGVPGHHFQIAIAQEREDLPLFRRLIPYTAYAEGWALYTEQLAWEAGFLEDPLDNLGRLQAEMLRAVRLVVDTGLHHARWSRQQAIDYMVDHTGMNLDEVSTEIDRYLVWPGQALAYKVGMLKLLELREQARTRLGERFDLRAFHTRVLSSGSLPLSVLEQVIEDWIREIERRQGG